MALTNNIKVEALLDGYVVPYLASAEDIFYQGALVCTNAAGKLVVAADAANNVFAGVVEEYKSAVADSVVKVRRNAVVWIDHTGAALTDIGDDVFASADDAVLATSTNCRRMGIVVGADTAGGRLLIDMSLGNAIINTTE